MTGAPGRKQSSPFYCLVDCQGAHFFSGISSRVSIRVPLPCSAALRSVSYDAAKERWSGMLTVPTPGGAPATFSGSGSGLFPLLTSLDKQYRATLKWTGGRQERLWPPDCGSSPMAGGRPSGEGSIQASPGRASATRPGGRG